MEPLPQPPPDAPAPPPDQAAIDSRGRMTMICVGGFLIIVLLFLSAPLLLRSRKASERTEAINNIKNLSTALFEFENEFGKFPDATTIAPVVRKTGTKLTLGDASSNQLFRQLIANGLDTERPFWAFSARGKRKPDENMEPGKALEPGECTFGYVAGLDAGGDGDTPFVFAPMVHGTRRFDPKPYSEMAVVLRLDTSAVPMRIREKTGQVMHDGMDIFDPRQPYWKGKAPDIRLPE